MVFETLRWSPGERLSSTKLNLIIDALEQLYTLVDSVVNKKTISGEIDTSSVTSPVTVLTPSSGKALSIKGWALATTSASGEITIMFANSGKIIGKLYASKTSRAGLIDINIDGNVDEPVVINWNNLDPGAKIFYEITYREG